MVLEVGNVLNGGTPKGRADGFDMQVVKSGKLKSLKDNKGKTLLQYVCAQLV